MESSQEPPTMGVAVQLIDVVLGTALAFASWIFKFSSLSYPQAVEPGIVIV